MSRLLCAAVIAVLLAVGCDLPEPEAEPADRAEERAEPTPKPKNDLVERFGCQWILDTYRPMASLGRDFAVMHLSNEMSLKSSAFEHIGTGDAAAALRECE